MVGIWNQRERIGKRKPWDQDQYFSVLWGSAHANFVRSNLVLCFWIRDRNVWYKTLESTTKQYASLRPLSWEGVHWVHHLISRASRDLHKQINAYDSGSYKAQLLTNLVG